MSLARLNWLLLLYAPAWRVGGLCYGQGFEESRYAGVPLVERRRGIVNGDAYLPLYLLSVA